MRITDSKIIEFIDIRHIFIIIVYLINDKHHRLLCTAQHICYLGVRIHKSLMHIHHKDDDICGINGDLRLLPHLGENYVPAVRLNTTGINQGKALIQPGHVRINTVSGNTRSILDNGNLRSCQCIK